MSNQKSVPLPCSEQEYKIIKMYCLVHGLKYADITKILLNIIKDNDNNDKIGSNNVSNMVRP